jgi:hypothetical protein
MRLGSARCGDASVPPTPAVCDALAMPCCADAAAASPSAAALRRCGCAQSDSTPLHWAAINGQVACVALLVERGANKEAKDKVRCAAPSPAAAAACCVGTAASAQRCALQKPGACAREGRNWRRLSVYLRLLPVCRAAQPPAPPRACAFLHACGHGCGAAAARHWRGGLAAQRRGRVGCSVRARPTDRRLRWHVHHTHRTR